MHHLLVFSRKFSSCSFEMPVQELPYGARSLQNDVCPMARFVGMISSKTLYSAGMSKLVCVEHTTNKAYVLRQADKNQTGDVLTYRSQVPEAQKPSPCFLLCTSLHRRGEPKIKSPALEAQVKDG